jgi:CPA2 family monovalent cation:H+ antiporter-2
VGTLTEELLIILCSSLAAALLFRRLGLPTIVAYMAVGAVIGPHALGFIERPEDFSGLAEFGVVFLLFSLGLEFSLTRMLKMKFIVFGVGSIQVAACTGVFAASVYLWGTTVEAAILIAGALALSSTAIVTRELGQHREMNKRYAQLAIGVLLFQDLIAVVFLILVPVLAASQETSLSQELFSALLRAGLLMVVLMSAGRWVLPHIYGEISKNRSREIFVLATLVIGMLAAWLTHQLHLSMTLGGFIIGMMLGESDFKHQIETDLRPFKDILLGLFFVTLGMSVDLSLLLDYWPRLLAFTAVLIFMKIAVVSVVVNLMGDTKRTALRSGITLAQAGEFGLALLALANNKQLVPDEQTSFIIILALLSMAASSLLIRSNAAVTDWLLPFLPYTRKETNHASEDAVVTLHENDHVIIGGYGRVGQTIASLLKLHDIPFIVIENDLGRVQRNRRRGVNIVYGDCNSLEILESCHIENARLAVLTFESHSMARNTLKQIRAHGWEVPVILRCYEEGELEELVSLGASHVVPEMLETRLLVADQVMNLLNLPPHIIEQQIDELRRKATGLLGP